MFDVGSKVMLLGEKALSLRQFKIVLLQHLYRNKNETFFFIVQNVSVCIPKSADLKHIRSGFSRYVYLFMYNRKNIEFESSQQFSVFPFFL